ncbi:hypothetical protein [Burkholderia territorii]|uniref:hypothetical protein n=1 Tax=Burkholderia territorii TaxID=1503055 RepID=UPI0012DA7964|nr:hypothetical protein [Burkholderia territorii]
MGMPTKPELLAKEIARLMSDNQHWTVTAVAKALNVTEERVRVAIRRLQSMHVIYNSQRIEPTHTNAYRLISAAQATSSELTVEQVHDTEREARLDRRHRRMVPSWPVGDEVLVKAMYAMVKAQQATPTDT